eukprot:9138045-Pyramimonas_sp.AAC.1
MGGTASPLLWCLGHDPLFSALANITGADDPMYVDDLAALLGATAQTLRAGIALPWLARTAGLLVKAHKCKGIEAPSRIDVRQHLATAP